MSGPVDSRHGTARHGTAAGPPSTPPKNRPSGAVRVGAHEPRPTVLIADDEVALADVIARYCGRAWRMLPVVAKLAELDATLTREHADGVLLDVLFADGESSMPQLPRRCAAYPRTKFVVHTGFPELASVDAAIAAGASGYLIKLEGDGLVEIGRAITAVLAGRQYITQAPPRIAIRHPPPPGGWADELARVQAALGITKPLAEVAVLRHHGVIPKAMTRNFGAHCPGAISPVVRAPWDRRHGGRDSIGRTCTAVGVGVRWPATAHGLSFEQASRPVC